MPHSVASRRQLAFIDAPFATSFGPLRVASVEMREQHYRLSFMGAFQLTAPNGQRLDLGSKKAVALLALLATAATGERWRTWIQEKLWGSLEPQRAQGGLRRELHRLRRLTEPYSVPLLYSDFRVVRLNLSVVDVDIKETVAANSGEFLEGLDLAGEDNFEQWLRDMRGGFVGAVRDSRRDHRSPVEFGDRSERSRTW